MSKTVSAIRNPLIEIVVPVLDEAAILDSNIKTLDVYMSKHLPYRYQITIADNGSTDATGKIARKLSKDLKTVKVIRLPQSGRGRALNKVWQASRADILSYMDADLSTSLDDFLPMIQPLIDGKAGISTGTRLAKDSQTTRGPKREFISRCYGSIVKLMSRTELSDLQCGFKAIRRDIASKLLPDIEDTGWFFDTELLIKAEHADILVHEQPVTWIENKDSRVKILRTALDNLKGLTRIQRELHQKSWLEKAFLPIALLVAGSLYLFGAMNNGMANSYYAMAVQAASQDWTAWFFGSLDSANHISIDKPPIATMIMGLSARIFGFSNFSMLLPSVLAGIGTIWLVYDITRRQFGFKSAAIATLTLILTPVAALMFGFNNPDAILTLLLIASGYAFLRSLENKKTLLWLSLAALFTGLAFNAKMLQGLMIVAAMIIVYIAFAKPPVTKRLAHIIFAGIITAVSTLWWSIIVWITPASSRPWIGSTDDNSIWSLIFGYNGFGRLLSYDTGQGGVAASTNYIPVGFGGETGLLRMFNFDFGPNIAWLLPAALIGGAVVLWTLRKTPRDNLDRAAITFWLLWLIIHIAIFSVTSGTIHPYYVVVLSPAIAALAGISLPALWNAYRQKQPLAIVLPAIVAVTSVVAIVLLGHENTYPWLAWLIGVIGGIGSIALAANLSTPAKDLLVGGVLASIIAVSAGPFVYTLATVNTTHQGSIPTSGPNSTTAGIDRNLVMETEELVSHLLDNRDGARWIVAVGSAKQAAPIQLKSGQPVMTIGGFSGYDRSLTLAQFKALISSGQLRYYIVSSGDKAGKDGNPRDRSEISKWVIRNGTKVEYGGKGVALYRLSAIQVTEQSQGWGTR